MSTRAEGRPIRILHMVPDLDVGGLQKGVVNLINGLPRDGFEHAVCCLHTTGCLRSRLEPTVPVHELRAGRHDLRTPIRLGRVIRQFQPDIIHARTWSTWPDSVMAKLMTRRGRLVFSLHGWDQDSAPSRVRTFACRRLARRTDHMVSVSAYAAELFAKEIGIEPGRFEIIRNGTDPIRLPSFAERQSIRRELGVNDRAFLIGSVGRLEAIKDYDTLLRSCAEAIRRARAEVGLLLVGDGSKRPVLEHLAQELRIADRVRFTGRRSDVVRLLGAMDAFAMTSRREGLNNAILEAMAGGLPVIATAVGGTPELIEDGVHGRLVPPGDVATITSAICGLVCDPALRKRWGSNARLRSLEEFSLSHMLRRYAGMYRRVARAASPAIEPAPDVMPQPI